MTPDSKAMERVRELERLSAEVDRITEDMMWDDMAVRDKMQNLYVPKGFLELGKNAAFLLAAFNKMREIAVDYKRLVGKAHKLKGGEYDVDAEFEEAMKSLDVPSKET